MSDAEAALDRADMDRLVAGQETALNRLMERHGGRLYAYLVRLLQDEGEAEDLAQETFVRIYEHRTRFDHKGSFRTWMFAIAGNLVRDRFRWRMRHPETPLETPTDDLPAGPVHDARHPNLTDPQRSPDAAALGVERVQAVQEAIAALPPDLRMPLLLAEFEERSHAEIATILECTPKAVEMRLYRARLQLRQHLHRWLAEETGLGA
ncbi:MAG: RNA polymerase sigma factor [Verrucomicrobiales bacterium]|nr:RNA polymerase sigma factor [Verrucomicrobiales bacterium]